MEKNRNYISEQEIVNYLRQQEIEIQSKCFQGFEAGYASNNPLDTTWKSETSYYSHKLNYGLGELSYTDYIICPSCDKKMLKVDKDDFLIIVYSELIKLNQGNPIQKKIEDYHYKLLKDISDHDVRSNGDWVKIIFAILTFCGLVASVIWILLNADYSDPFKSDFFQKNDWLIWVSIMATTGILMILFLFISNFVGNQLREAYLKLLGFKYEEEFSIRKRIQFSKFYFLSSSSFSNEELKLAQESIIANYTGLKSFEQEGGVSRGDIPNYEFNHTVDYPTNIVEYYEKKLTKILENKTTMVI